MTGEFWGGMGSLVLAATAIMGSPGPTNISAAAVGASFGIRRAIPYVSGLALGTMLVVLLVAVGLTGLIAAIPHATVVLRLAASAYILYLAWQIATAPPAAAATADVTAPRLAGGVLLGVANPKAWFAIAAVFAGSTVSANPTADAAAKLVILSLMVALIQAAWLLLGASMSRLLQDPVRSRQVNIGMAAVLVVATGLSLLP